MIKIFSPNSYNKERNYIYNVVFKEWLGINYSSFNHEYPYTLITSNEINSDKEIIIDDILFSISKKKVICSLLTFYIWPQNQKALPQDI